VLWVSVLVHVPEWYFLPFYSTLRACSIKVVGVILLGTSVLIYMVLLLVLAEVHSSRGLHQGLVYALYRACRPLPHSPRSADSSRPSVLPDSTFSGFYASKGLRICGSMSDLRTSRPIGTPFWTHSGPIRDPYLGLSTILAIPEYPGLGFNGVARPHTIYGAFG